MIFFYRFWSPEYDETVKKFVAFGEHLENWAGI